MYMYRVVKKMVEHTGPSEHKTKQRSALPIMGQCLLLTKEAMEEGQLKCCSGSWGQPILLCQNVQDSLHIHQVIVRTCMLTIVRSRAHII